MVGMNLSNLFKESNPEKVKLNLKAVEFEISFLEADRGATWDLYVEMLTRTGWRKSRDRGTGGIPTVVAPSTAQGGFKTVQPIVCLSRPDRQATTSRRRLLILTSYVGLDGLELRTFRWEVSM